MFFAEYLPWGIYNFLEKVKPLGTMCDHGAFFLLQGCLQSNSTQEISFSPLLLVRVGESWSNSAN